RHPVCGFLRQNLRSRLAQKPEENGISIEVRFEGARRNRFAGKRIVIPIEHLLPEMAVLFRPVSQWQTFIAPRGHCPSACLPFPRTASRSRPQSFFEDGDQRDGCPRTGKSRASSECAYGQAGP